MANQRPLLPRRIVLRQTILVLGLILLLGFPVAVSGSSPGRAAASKKPFRTPDYRSWSASLPRGGSLDLPSSASSSIPQPVENNPKSRPSWLKIDRETLQAHLQLAKQRHADSIRKAQESYWSGNESDGEKTPTQAQLPPMVTYGINNMPSTWKLPDFSSDLDPSRMIFVTQGHAIHQDDEEESPLFSKETCQNVIELAEAHFAGRDWSRLPSGQYDVAGFWIRDIPAVHAWFNEVLQTKLFPLVVRQFPDFCDSIDDLCVDNAYLFKYTPETGRRTGIHTDSGCLSFTIALNNVDEYQGGGTWFQGLTGKDNGDSSLEMKCGHVTVRPGGVRHAGHAVTAGTRYIIGGFCMHKHKCENVRMLIGLGNERANSGDFRGAQKALEAALWLNPNFDGAYTHLADIYEKLNDIPKAIQVLEHCLQHVNPENGEVAYSLSVLYLKQKKYDKAQECAEICLTVDDCDADAMGVLAQSSAAQGNPTKEEEWYRRIVATPGVGKETAASAYCNLGVLKEGDAEEISLYETALALVPDNFQSRFSLASAHAARQEWKSAAESFRKALDLTDDEELQSQALSSLYRVAVFLVQNEMQAAPPSQEKMMARFQEIMGRENYERLAAGRQ